MNDTEILLGEARGEVLILKNEKSDLEEALAVMKQQYETAKAELETERQRSNLAVKNLNDHLEDLKRAGLAAQKLLGSLEEQLRTADALRNRLLKVTAALAAIDRYFLLHEAGASKEELEEAKRAYSLAKVQLGTLDVPATGSGKPDLSAVKTEDIEAAGIYLAIGCEPQAYIRHRTMGYLALSGSDVDWVRSRLEEKLRGGRSGNDNEPNEASGGG